MSRFHAFSPYDLELLVADLLGAEDGVHYEVFPPGRDQGIDLRHVHDDGSRDVVQVKHYERSSFNDLKRDVAAEVPKIQRLDPQPATYRLVTSKQLSPSAKDQLVAVLGGLVRGQQDVIGGDELARRVNSRPDVERRHPKLWLSSGAHLSEMIHSSVRARSRALMAEIEALLPRYVRHSRFAEARRRLHDGKVLVIAGDPGVGKTTLAHVLVADAVRSGYDEPVQVLSNLEEAWSVFDPARRQVIVYDDFLGRTALRRVEKNEDRSLGAFMREVAKVPHTLFLLTTREYILRDAQQHHVALAEGQIDERHFLLHLRQYSLLDRAHIFVNHAFHSGQLSSAARAALAADDAWRRIVDHPNYNPRTVSYITGMAGRRLRAEQLEDYVGFAEGVLADPGLLWRETFRDELASEQQALLLAVAAMPDDAEVGDLERAFNGICPELGLVGGGEAFQEALRALDDSMLSSHEQDGHIFVTTRDPSVRDYLVAHLAVTPEHARAILRGATHWDQVLWIGGTVLSRHLDQVDADFIEAADRLFDATPATFSPVHWFDDPVPVLTRDSLDRSLRLNQLRAQHEQIPALEGLESLRAKHLSAHLEGLGSGDIYRSATLELLAAEHRAALARTRAIAAARNYFTSGLTYPLAWEQLRAFRKLFPELFTDEDWLELGRRCHSWAAERLANTDDLSGSEEVSDIADEARKMGRPLPEELIDQAREAVYGRDGYGDEPLTDDATVANDNDLPLEVQVDRARALFVRLAIDGEPATST